METRIGTCSECGEQDYLDYTALIDHKRYCNACWHEELGRQESRLIESVFPNTQGAAV